jgi:hypothetical protein
MKSIHDWTVGNLLAAWLIWLAAIAVVTVVAVLLVFVGAVKGPVALRIPLSWTVWLLVPPILLTALWLWRRTRP